MVRKTEIKLNQYEGSSEQLDFNEPVQKERIYSYYKSKYSSDYSFIRDEGLFWKKFRDVLTDTEENCYMTEFRPYKSKRMIKLSPFNEVLEFWKKKYGYDPHNDNMESLNQTDKTKLDKSYNTQSYDIFDDCESD